MTYEVRVEEAGPRRLAAIRATVEPAQLGASIIGLLDKIWPVLREQAVETRHNVVIYYGASPGTLDVAVGVEVPSGFTAAGEIRDVSTPVGPAATTAHFGEYSDLGGAYEALEHWCEAHARPAAGVRWEVYGDWEEDPARRRTDLYFQLAS
jgi:effector-binding domain-containing protein